LERSRRGSRIAKGIRPLLPTGQKLQRLLPLPMLGRTLWAVLSCEERKDVSSGREDCYQHENAQCSVFEEYAGQRLTRIWKSKVISSDDDRPLVEPGLCEWKMTGRRIPELVFYSGFSSGSWNPSVMQIYRWRDGTFRQVFEAEGACSHWIADVHRTGLYQVRSLDLIGGIEMGHSALVHWPLIYDWNGTRYVEANAKHPEEFQKARQDILDKLKRFPDNPVLWKYLGYAYLYSHHRRSACAAFRKADPGYRAMLQDEEMREDGWQGLGELAEISGDRSEASRCFQQVARACRTLAAKEKDAYVQQSLYDRVKLAVKRARHPRIGQYRYD
jgi:hypothetical protein